MRLLFILLLFVNFIFSNKEKNILTDITYNETQDIQITKYIKDNTLFNSYLTKNDILVSVGDTLIIGKPYGNMTQHHTSVNISTPSYQSILIGDLNKIFKMGIGVKFLPSYNEGRKLIVESLYAQHSGNKNTPISIITIVSDLIKKEECIIKDCDELFYILTITEIDSSIEIGEIKFPNSPMTKEEAISKLKESKELLDLEIITQDEYDKLKQELAPIIKGK